MVPDRARLWYQTFPRLCAFAETGWTAARKKDWHSFMRRLPAMLARIRGMGASHAPLRHTAPGPVARLFSAATIRQEQTGRAP
jgi:N-acetyl-beta-hexosaminidase